MKKKLLIVVVLEKLKNLDRAGFRPVDRHEIVKEKSAEELNAQLVSLVGEDGAQLLVGAFRSRRSISGRSCIK
jgi:hypothetical protein